MITGDLKNKVDRLWLTFHSNGISNPLTVIEQISYLLFIKRLDDEELAKEKRANRLGRPATDLRFGPKQQAMRWSHFKNLGDADAMLKVVRDQAFPFIKALGGTAGETSYARHMKDAIFMVGSPALLANVIDQIDALPMADRDTKGDLYEYMLSKLTTAGTNGQFRTPRHIIKMMVAMIDPKPSAGETICDPACGTAGFLVAAAEHVRDAMLADASLRNHYNAGMFRGYDFDATMLRIGSMNMMLHGIENPVIESRDSLAGDGDDDQSCTLILANPPFQGNVEQSTINPRLRAMVDTTKTEVLFVAKMIRMLKKGGRAAVVVPDGLLFDTTRAHLALRQEIVDRHALEAVISLPGGVFRPYTGMATAILFFVRTGSGGTDKVWFYNMEADGMSLDDRRLPQAQNDIPDLLALWRANSDRRTGNRTGKYFHVPSDEIRKMDYVLSFNRYQEHVQEKVHGDEIRELRERLFLLQDQIDEATGRVRELIR